ncbi:MAG: hypothetical protein ACYC91_07535 [Solirubrobacteraceae bacterium]
MGEAHERRDAAARRFAADPVAGFRGAITAFFEAFGTHRAVTLAGVEARARNPEVRELWGQVMEGWGSMPPRSSRPSAHGERRPAVRRLEIWRLR